MSLEGEQLDELLSGYVDGQLSAEEVQRVELALQRNDVRRKLEGLVAVRQALSELGHTQPRRLPDDFQSRVLAAIERSERPELTRQVVPSRPHSPRWRWTRVAALVASLSAALLIAVNWSGFWDGSETAPQAHQDTTASPTGESLASRAAERREADPDSAVGDPAPQSLAQDQTPGAELQDVGRATTLPVSYLGDVEAPILFAYVMHVQPTASALHSGLIESILLKAGIKSVAPIVANASVEDALRDTSMIVTPNEMDGESIIYFVRAEATAIDRAFGEIWSDTDNYPGAHYNLAMDNPQTRLMRQIAQSTGQRFAIDESFAAPVAIVDPQTGSDSTLAAGPEPVYVSASRRGSDFGQASGLAGFGGELSTVLIVVHLPNDR